MLRCGLRRFVLLILQEQLLRIFDRNMHSARCLIYPAIGFKYLIFARSQLRHVIERLVLNVVRVRLIDHLRRKL